MSNERNETKRAVSSGPNHAAFLDGLKSGELGIRLDEKRIASHEIYPYFPEIYVWLIILRFIFYPLAVIAVFAAFIYFDLHRGYELGAIAIIIVAGVSGLIRGFGEYSVQRRMRKDSEFYCQMISQGFAKIEQASDPSRPLPPSRIP